MPDPISDAILQSLVETKNLPIDEGVRVREQLEKNEGTIYDLLVGVRKVNEEQYTKAYAQALDMPYVDVRDLTIDKKVLDIIPESTAREHMIIAYEQTDDAIKLAMANPGDRQIVEFVRKKVDKQADISLGSMTSIRETLAKYQGTLEADLQQVINEAKKANTDDENLSKAAEDLPIIKIVDTILRHAIVKGASDIHIEPTEDSVIVRYRIDGILQDVMVLPKTVLAGIAARIKILSNLKIDEHRLPQDGRFKLESDDYQVAFRVSTLPVFDGEKIVMRLLDESGHGAVLDGLGMGAKHMSMFREAIGKPNGMILVTGPTGSGKTTTLYAAMRELNTPDVNISTIEDPIEYRMERINQTQVQAKVGLTFSNGLRALVRQDPDIIMVGEIRDEETASLAVNAALTGHLVLSTLHTNSAAGAVPRLMDMKIEPFLIASTVNLVLAQRLVRKLCETCKKQTVVDQGVIDSLADIMNVDHLLELLKQEKIIEDGATAEQIPMFRAEGCSKCHEGYKGRAGIYEMFEMSASIQKLITGTVTADSIQEVAKEEQQMATMLEDGMIKVARGFTSVEEVLRVANE